jgi:hypothetical protein
LVIVAKSQAESWLQFGEAWQSAGVLIGFESKDDWFLHRIEQARMSLRAGRGIWLDGLEKE